MIAAPVTAVRSNAIYLVVGPDNLQPRRPVLFELLVIAPDRHWPVQRSARIGLPIARASFIRLPLTRAATKRSNRTFDEVGASRERRLPGIYRNLGRCQHTSS